MKGNAVILLVILITVGLVAALTGCSSDSGSAASSENQVITVQRGDLTIDITAAGNLALSTKEDLAFEISGTEQEPLTVEEVLGEEGDSVEEGQVLVTLDTAALEEKVTTREQAVNTAELSARTAELSVTTAEINLQDANDEESVKSAEIALETATDNYRKITYPYNYTTFAFDVPAAIGSIHEAELLLEKVRTGLEKGPGSEEYGELWHNIGSAQSSLEQARERLSRGLQIRCMQVRPLSPTPTGE